jgi:hypothetical protein
MLLKPKLRKKSLSLKNHNLFNSNSLEGLFNDSFRKVVEKSKRFAPLVGQVSVKHFSKRHNSYLKGVRSQSSDAFF